MVGARTLAISSSDQIGRRSGNVFARREAAQIKYNSGRQFAHALEVSQRAHGLKTWAAHDVDSNDAGKLRQRWSVFRARRAEQGNQRDADRRGGVHQPRVVADHNAGGGQKVDRGPEVRTPAGVAYFGN